MAKIKKLVCVVCGNNNRDNFNSVYYKLPNCPLRRDKWIQLLNIEEKNLKSTSRVCQQHFPKSQYIRMHLIKNAMPKNLRKLDTLSDQLQVKENVSMDKGEEPEKEIIRNISIRRGQKPTGEVCLICAQIPDPLEINQPPLASDYISSFLNPHLWSMFVLKLLNFPNEECQNVFRKTFGVNPGDWFRLCGPCFKIMEQAFTLEQEVAKLQKQLNQVKLNATRKLEKSLKLDKNKVSKKKSTGLFDISKYIRQVLKDIPNKQRMESPTPTIKTEEEIKDEDFDECPKSTYEAVISECVDDLNTNINVTAINEAVAVEDPFDFDTGKKNISDDNHHKEVEIQTHNLVIKYRCNKNVKRKIAKKLKLTAIKRCRLPESVEQTLSNKVADTISKTHRPTPFRLTCSLCPAKFMKRLNLKLHLDTHIKYKDTSCPKCNFPCNTQEKLKRHLTLKRCSFQGQGSSLLGLSSASHENHEKCHICGRIYPGKIQLKKHVTAHRQYKHTTCPVCKLPCTSRLKLENHMKICNFAVGSSNTNKSQADGFKCDLCSYTTDYPHVFSGHKRLHEQAKFNCEVCSYPSLTSSTLDVHMKEMHCFSSTTPGDSVNKNKAGRPKQDIYMGGELLSCHLCPALFSSERKVNIHVRNVHEKKYSCSECETSFRYNSHLQNHLLDKHGIEKTMFICDTCGMQFSTYPAIYTHKKKFHSYISDKSNSSEGTEDANKVSKYERKCPHCVVSCCNMKALKIHMRASHPELYKHKCDLCPLTYISSTNLKIHIKNFHLKEEVECEKCKAKMRGCSMREHLKRYCMFRLQTDANGSKIVSDGAV